MRFIKYNANPKDWKDGDCVVRAVATATQQNWLTTFDDLCKIARKKCRMPNSNETYAAYLKEKGFERMKQDKDEFGRWLDISELVDRYPNSILVIHCRHHLTVAIEGVLIDTWHTGNERAGRFYKKDISELEEGDIIRYLQFVEENKMEVKPRRVRL